MPFRIIGLISLVSLCIYVAMGITFLVRDHHVVSRCHPSNDSVHVIWETSLWTYVLWSVIFAVGDVAMFLTLQPVLRVVEALQKVQESRRKHRDNVDKIGPFSFDSELDMMQRRRARFGIMDDLPDWIFLLHGTAFLALATATGILAMFGYYELWAAKPWCEDRNAAFEELDLWYFGRATFYFQLISVTFLSVLGILFWALPFTLELSDPDPERAPILPNQRRHTAFP